MKPIDLIRAKREHVACLANLRGSLGEKSSIADMEHWMPRPSGAGLKVLLEELKATGKIIKGSSFDAVYVPGHDNVDFSDRALVRSILGEIQFIEIKTTSREKVKLGFSGFFFALTEGEIVAADVLGEQHRVALYNKVTVKFS